MFYEFVNKLIIIHIVSKLFLFFRDYLSLESKQLTGFYNM